MGEGVSGGPWGNGKIWEWRKCRSCVGDNGRSRGSPKRGFIGVVDGGVRHAGVLYAERGVLVAVVEGAVSFAAKDGMLDSVAVCDVGSMVRFEDFEAMGGVRGWSNK